MKEKKPEIVVFAGPNGSGKSTFTELLKPDMDYINADEIKKNIKCSDIEAAKLAEKQRGNSNHGMMSAKIGTRKIYIF